MIKDFKLFEMAKKVKNPDIDPYGEERWNEEEPQNFRGEVPGRNRRGEVNVADILRDRIQEIEPGTKLYVLRQIESGLFMYKPNQWRNILTDDPRKAKVYTSRAMANADMISRQRSIKSVTHDMEFNLRNQKGKWELVEVKSVNLGAEQPLI